MGLYECARCGNWKLSEEDPPSFDERLPADSVCLVCEGCSEDIERIDFEDALDAIFGKEQR